MSVTSRPILGLNSTLDPVTPFVDELQAAIDSGDPQLFNNSFAQDVLWGSPFGAVAEGYDQIHAFHARMFASVPATPGAAKYEVEKIRQLSEDVVIAFVRRMAVVKSAQTNSTLPGSFDELAMMVLVARDGRWWLAAAQHVPDRRDVYK